MRKRIIPVVFPVFVFLYGMAFAQPPDQGKACPQVSPELRQSIQRTIASKPEDLFVVLKNGLTLLVHQQPGAEVVSTQVFVRAGSVLEGKYMGAGLSHYLEHVVAGGSTRSFTEVEAKDRLQAIGGSTNAYTTYDRTVYYINTATDRWKEALDLLLSYVTESRIDPNEVAREKAVIQQEMKLGESNPNSTLWKLFVQTAYRESPVRSPVIGFEEIFVQQSREALLDYYLQRYRPENEIVVVAGNVGAEDVLKFVVEKTKDFLPRASEPVVLAQEPPQSSARWEEKEVPIARLVQAMIGFPSVTAHDRDLYALDVLAQLLGEGETCRLRCRLKEQENKVYSIGASNWTPAFVRGQFIVSVSLSAQQWPGVLNDIQQEIEAFQNSAASAEELQKAKKTAIASHIFGKASVSAMASSFASSYMFTGDPYFDDKYTDEIRKVTAEEVQSVARRYLVSDRMNVAVIKPPSPQQEQVAAACPVPADSPIGYNRLANGLKTLVKKDAGLPYVTMQMYGTGGLMLEDRDNAGISAFTAALLTSGTRTKTRLELLGKVEDAGGVIDARSDNNTYHISLKVLKEDFDWALDLLSDIVRDASFPQDEIEKNRQDTIVAIKRSDESWQSEVVRLFKRNYFREASYGNDRLGTVDSVKAFTRDDVLSFYRRMVNPTHSVLAVFGDIDPVATEAMIREKFGSWSGAPVNAALPRETTQVSEDRLVEIRNEKSSSALFIGTNGMDVDDVQRPVLDVLTSVLSGGGSPAGRMFDSLRGGNQNLVYTVGTFPFYGKNAGFFGVITQTTLANLDQVQEIVLGNLKKLGEELVPEAELQKAKETMLVAQKLGRESLDSQAGNAALDEVLGLGYGYGRRYPELVEAVTAEQVKDLAGKLFAHTLIVRTLPENPVEILAAPPPPGNDVRM